MSEHSPEHSQALDPARESFWKEGDDDEVAIDLRHHLQVIANVLKKRSVQSKHFESKVGYRVVKRGDQDARRFEEIDNYGGPDESTLDLLKSHSKSWMTTPLSFWLPPGLGNPSIPRVADIFLKSGLFPEKVPNQVEKSRKKVEQTIKDMDDFGHRYKALEKQLEFPGLCFVLGNGLSESFWCKLMPKKPDAPKFKHVKNKLISIGIKEEAAPYANLRDVVVKHKLDELLKAMDQSPQSSGTLPAPASSDVGEVCNGGVLSRDAIESMSGNKLQDISFSSTGASASMNMQSFCDINTSSVDNWQPLALTDEQLLNFDFSLLREDATILDPAHNWSLDAFDSA
ncbi:hypothetical protein CB0940_05369 [Cercospora beticola]|uniref:Uncharacterized protein n=1 Tax=Cercospora beticola TaxID=122368 RepID=A0A2G5HX81_CERBT|nr:hypothetical protein CB0940_05369 [Cercospora beticola]PIA97174.1 hypothetical protein CB0940_05369 [Cercospora beticola]WPA97906.1 hypothetical protein RHO25_002517 [Cercospora beticola]